MQPTTLYLDKILKMVKTEPLAPNKIQYTFKKLLNLKIFFFKNNTWFKGLACGRNSFNISCLILALIIF